MGDSKNCENMFNKFMTLFTGTDTRRKQCLHKSSVYKWSGHGYFSNTQSYRLDRKDIEHGRIDTDGIKSYIEQHITSCNAQLLNVLRLVNINEYNFMKYDGIVFTNRNKPLLSVQFQDDTYLHVISIDIDEYVRTLESEYMEYVMCGLHCLALASVVAWGGARIYTDCIMSR